jgi:neutral ceramidase
MIRLLSGLCLVLLSGCAAAPSSAGSRLRVGAAAVELEADDSMVIGGSIHAGKAKGQEGKLRAVAVVLDLPGSGTFAIVACDVLMMNRDLLDAAAAELEKTAGIPFAHVLINCTHTHHAPSTCAVHGYARDEVFSKRMAAGVVLAVRDACARRCAAEFVFARGEESSVGMNSRLLLKDNGIFWIGPRDDVVRPTGPFDPELPVLAFRGRDGKPLATIFNHSTHTIGTRQGGVRSPSFYGLAAQELEGELGGVVQFLEGASGSTHNLGLPCAEAVTRIKSAVQEAFGKAQPRPVASIAAIKREFSYRVRRFEEEREEEAVSAYCRKRVPNGADGIIKVFFDQRRALDAHQGETRKTWLQAIRIGDVAVVGVPGEYFTNLGLDIKRRSPFRYTFVAELANDWIGYLPDRKAFEFGGYQTWTGLHSFAEPGTGEAVADEIVKMLDELAK